MLATPRPDGGAIVFPGGETPPQGAQRWSLTVYSEASKPYNHTWEKDL